MTRTAEILASLPLFEGLPSEAVGELAAASTRVEADAGTVLFHEGDPGDALHAIESGSVDILGRDGRVLATFEAGQCFGEIALVSESQRSASVRVREAGAFIALPRGAFMAVAERQPTLRAALGRILLQRLPGLRAATTSIFADIDHELLKEIESEMRWVVVSRGDALFHEGDAGDELFVLLQGRMTAMLPHGRRREMGRGEVIGEMALLGRAPRSATVIAERDSVLVGLSREGFQRAVQQHPAALFGVAHTLVERIRDPAGHGQGTVSTVAVVSFVDPAAADALLPALERALAAHGPTRRLRRATYLERFPASSLLADDAMRVLPSRQWLSEQAAAHRFLVYDVRPDEPDWYGLALAEADRVLVLVPDVPPSDAALRVIEAARPSRAWLLMCHERRPLGATNMAAWRARLPGAETLHIDDAGFAGIARRLDGRALGLALGGGGARAFAHLGVVRALREAGVELDAVAGSSMGAFVGATVAAGMGWRDATALARRVWAAPDIKRRWTLPVFSLLDVSDNERAVREALGDIDITDLRLPFFATASDITTPALRILDEGPIWRALRMSGAFPGLSAPVPDRGRIHVDGGMFNNLPIDVLRGRLSGPVLACDVGAGRVMEVDPGLTESPRPRLRHLVSRAARGSFPTFARVLVRTVECCDQLRSSERRELATHCFTPPVEHIGLMDFHRLDEAVELGYRHASEALAAGALDLLRDAPAGGPA